MNRYSPHVFPRVHFQLQVFKENWLVAKLTTLLYWISYFMTEQKPVRVAFWYRKSFHFFLSPQIRGYVNFCNRLLQSWHPLTTCDAASSSSFVSFRLMSFLAIHSRLIFEVYIRLLELHKLSFCGFTFFG